MTLAAPASPPVAAGLSPFVPVLAAGLAMALIVMSQTVPDLARGPADPDIIMRLQQVRDLLAGQAFHDVAQHRLGTPDGVAMHWSRLVDLPIAGLILAFSAVTDRATAEMLALIAWPAVLGAAFVGSVVAVSLRLAGREAAWPAALMALFAIHVRYLFSAGNIDHHNVQLVLALWMTAALVRLDRGRVMGACAGLAAAVMMAVGLETLLLIALAGAAAALATALDPRGFAPGAAAFGLTFATATALLFVLAMPPPRAGSLTCDVLSAPYLAAIVIGGAGLAATALLGERWRAPLRWSALLAVGASAAGAAFAIEPRCLAGPYAELDPTLVARWLASVDEAKSWRQLLSDDAGKAIAIMGAPLVGLVVAVAALRRAAPADRFAWAVVAAAGALTLIPLLMQIRGAAFAAAFALPAGAWLMTVGRRRSAALPGAAGVAVLLAACLAPQSILYEGFGRAVNASGLLSAPVQPVTLAMAGGPAASPATACFERANFAPLDALPPTRILAPSNLGPSIVAHTRHAALAGPYHRDRAGLLDAMDAFEGDPRAALDIARRRGLTVLAWCTGDSTVPGTAMQRPDSLSARLVRGDLPPWLVPLDDTGPVRLYRIMRP